MSEVEIRKVANGYLVYPPLNNTGRLMQGNDAHVFETFDSLVKFLRETLEGPTQPDQERLK